MTKKIFIALLEIADLAREVVSAVHGSRCMGVEGFVLEKSLLLLPSCNLFVHPLLKATVIQSNKSDNYFTYFISSLSYQSTPKVPKKYFEFPAKEEGWTYHNQISAVI